MWAWCAWISLVWFLTRTGTTAALLKITSKLVLTFGIGISDNNARYHPHPSVEIDPTNAVSSRKVKVAKVIFRHFLDIYITKDKIENI
jgi:hypothetical protein